MFSGDESHVVDRIHEMSAIGARRTLVLLLVADSERATSLERTLRLNQTTQDWDSCTCGILAAKSPLIPLCERGEGGISCRRWEPGHVSISWGSI